MQLLRRRRDAAEGAAGPAAAGRQRARGGCGRTSSWDSWCVSPDGQLLAWSVDLDGDEVYELRFRDLDDRSGPRRRDPAPLLRRRLERGLGRTSSTRSTTTRTGRTRCGGTGSAPRSTTDVLVLEEPDEQFELNVRADPQRRPGRDLVREPRHPRGLGRRRPRARTGRPGRSAGADAGWSTTPSTCVLADGSDALLVVTNDGATEFRLARCPVPRDADQDASAWSRSAPRTRPNGWSGSTPSPTTWCWSPRVRGPHPAADR